MLLGLAIRSGAIAPINLPTSVWEVIAGCQSISTAGLRRDSTGNDAAPRETTLSLSAQAASMALRHGITTIYPEVRPNP